MHCLARYRSWIHVPCVLLSLSAVVNLSGCGGGSGGSPDKPRTIAKGKVDYDGKPVTAGVITFTNKAAGNAVSLKIKDGAYSSTKTDGPYLGETAVVIVGKDKPDGDAIWSWPTKADVGNGEKEYVGDFSIKAADATPITKKRVKDD